ARLGWWVLVLFTVATAVSVLSGAALKAQHGRLPGSMFGNLVLVAGLVLSLWEGARWARWALVGLGAVSLALQASIAFGVQGIPDDLVPGPPWKEGVDAVSSLLGVSLALPWVGAYLAARRGAVTADPGAAPSRAGM